MAFSGRLFYEEGKTTEFDFNVHALAELDDITKFHPDQLIGKTGRECAEILKSALEKDYCRFMITALRQRIEAMKKNHPRQIDLFHDPFKDEWGELNTHFGVFKRWEKEFKKHPNLLFRRTG